MRPLNGDEQSDAIHAGTSSTRLEVREVHVSFGGIRALDGVTFAVGAGEVVGLIGPNGAGKTTLFDVISGATPASGGRVLFDGDDITTLAPTARARRGMRRTFQRIQTFGWLTVEDNVLTALDWHSGGGGFLADLVGLRTRRRRERARRAEVAAVLDRCGLTAVKDDLAGSLPIGIGRMVELARAIVDRPRLLLLDEPASGLDEREAARLGEQIHAVRDAEGCSVLLVEHDPVFVMGQCDRVVVLDRGCVLAEGSPAQIQSDASVRSAYLGSSELDA